MVDKRKARYVKTMKNPSEWNHWPILPLVKRKTQQYSFLIAEGKPNVYLENMFRLGEVGYALEDVVTKVRHIEYDSFEKVVDDGWEVDYSLVMTR